MKYTVYTGCTVPAMTPHYEASALAVCDALGIELEVLHAPCCGNPLRPVSQINAVKMATYVLGLAAEKGYPVMTLCNACNGFLLEAQTHPDTQVLNQFSFDFEIESLKIKHFIDILYEDIGVKTISSKTNSLDITVAVHHGCHLFRPSTVYNKNPEYPCVLDELVEACGVKSPSYKHKSMCCGSPLIGVDIDTSLKMAGTKLQEVSGKVDALVVSCPGCGIMYDQKQNRASLVMDTSFDVPVLYYSQLLGLAMGIPVTKLGFSMNRIKVDSVLKKVVP
jgi:heterodisulfide reductase subunit B